MCVGEEPVLSAEVIDKLKVCDVNMVLLAEVIKIRNSLTPEKAMEIVLKSLDSRIAALRVDVHSPLSLDVAATMMW
jgi:hypothetical protein